MAEEERKKEFVQVDKEDLATLIDDLLQTKAVVSLAHSVAEEHAGGEWPWWSIQNVLELSSDRIEDTILGLQSIRDPELEQVGTGTHKAE